MSDDQEQHDPNDYARWFPESADPVCTCDEYDEYPVCPIHRWVGPGVAR